MSEKLKPCPFCGEKVKVILTENIQVDGIFYVVTRGNTKKNNCHCRLFFESELMPRNASKWTRKAVFDAVEYAARCYFCGYERTDEKTKEIVAKMWERRLNDETD